ncbi:MAG: alpha/beta fold hydrolase [Solirubrobacteraceae bacterium]
MSWSRRQLSGARVRVYEVGDGALEQAVVFIHGNPGSADDWVALADAAAGVRLRAVAFDLPDFGDSTAARGFAHDVLSYAGFVDELLSALGVRRAQLVLHDFGGPIGLVWAAAHADRLASATLIDTGVLPGYRWHRMARLWRTPVVGELVQALTFREGFRRSVAGAEPRGLPRDFLDRMYDQYDRRTRQAVLKLYRATGDPGAAGEAFSAHMATLDIPALVIWGERDAYLPSSYATRQRDAFPSAEVHVLPASGHWPFVDSPEIVQRLLIEFVGRAHGNSAAAGDPVTSKLRTLRGRGRRPAL